MNNWINWGSIKTVFKVKPTLKTNKSSKSNNTNNISITNNNDTIITVETIGHISTRLLILHNNYFNHKSFQIINHIIYQSINHNIHIPITIDSSRLSLSTIILTNQMIKNIGYIRKIIASTNKIF